jgi:hypothetical protein
VYGPPLNKHCTALEGPASVRISNARALADELGDLVLSEVPPPTGAGRWYPFRFEDGTYTREFEDRKRTVHGIDVQIVGTQVVDNVGGSVSTTRKLRVCGQADLAAEEAQAVASTILGDVKRMQDLDSQDNGE